MTVVAVPEVGCQNKRESEDRCRVYRSEFGLDAHIVPRTGAIHLSAISMSAVLISPALGRAVVELLDAVPAFSIDRRGHRLWALLGDAPVSQDDADRAKRLLFKVGAIPVLWNATVVLPTPGNPHRVWLHPPRGRARPALAAIGQAITTAVSRDAGLNR